MSNNILPARAQKILQSKFGNASGEPNAHVHFSRVCSCVAANNMAYDPRCNLCVYGNIYNPTPEEVLVTRTAMKIDRSVNERMYNFYMGGARITFYKYDLAGKAVNAYKYISQYDIVVVPGDIRSNNSANVYGKKDQLYCFDVTEIESVSSIEPDENGVKYEKMYKEGLDYQAEKRTDITTIKWLGDNHPTDYYTVRYLSSVNYLVWEDNPKMRGGSDSEDPRVVYCTLRPYFDPNKSPYLDVPTNAPLINKRFG